MNLLHINARHSVKSQIWYTLLKNIILSGFCTLKCPNSIVFNIKIFLKFKFEICAYTQLKKKLMEGGGCATPSNVPKLGVSGVKDTAKTDKDLGMSCYIQVEYSVFFRR